MKWIAAIPTLLLYGCSAFDASSLRWTEDMIRGMSFESMSDSGVLSMRFPESGDYVVTTIGERHGDIAGPVYEWRINKAGRLVFLENMNELDEFKLIRFTPSEVEVRHLSHGTVIYRRTSNGDPNGEQGEDT